MTRKAVTWNRLTSKINFVWGTNSPCPPQPPFILKTELEKKCYRSSIPLFALRSRYLDCLLQERDWPYDFKLIQFLTTYYLIVCVQNSKKKILRNSIKVIKCSIPWLNLKKKIWIQMESFGCFCVMLNEHLLYIPILQDSGRQTL